MASVTIRARTFARGDILGMYKECLTLVRSFPSIKRDELYEDIRTGECARPAPPGERARATHKNTCRAAALMAQQGCCAVSTSNRTVDCVRPPRLSTNVHGRRLSQSSARRLHWRTRKRLRMLSKSPCGESRRCASTPVSVMTTASIWRRTIHCWATAKRPECAATFACFAGVESKSARWTLDLEQDPLGQSYHEQRRAEEEEARQRAQAEGKNEDHPKERLSLQELQDRTDALAAREDALREEHGDVFSVSR